MGKTLRALITKRLDGRSAIAVAVRRWKEDVRRDLGGDLTRARDNLHEAAAQAWVIVLALAMTTSCGSLPWSRRCGG